MHGTPYDDTVHATELFARPQKLHGPTASGTNKVGDDGNEHYANVTMTNTTLRESPAPCKSIERCFFLIRARSKLSWTALEEPTNRFGLCCSVCLTAT